jgi:hypothetical protein
MHVLLVGYEPEAVDFSDPALTPGLDAQKIHAGIAIAMKDMLDRGWTADHCFIRPDSQAAAAVSRQLASAKYDCLVIGAGVRAWTRHLPIFEAVINAARKAAPTVPIAFNTKPQDSAEAVERACGRAPSR